MLPLALRGPADSASQTKLFESLAESLPESPHFLALVLAASKFLDLLITLQTEDFQMSVSRLPLARRR